MDTDDEKARESLSDADSCVDRKFEQKENSCGEDASEELAKKTKNLIESESFPSETAAEDISIDYIQTRTSNNFVTNGNNDFEEKSRNNDKIVESQSSLDEAQ